MMVEAQIKPDTIPCHTNLAQDKLQVLIITTPFIINSELMLEINCYFWGKFAF